MQVEKISALFDAAERIAVLSGAGLSKASGIPTYRDNGGLWTQEGIIRFSSAAELKKNPEGFRDFWAARQSEIKVAQANPGHFALARLQLLRPEVTLMTQNVDGLLMKAEATGVLELHGSLLRDRCGSCRAVFPSLDEASLAQGSRCPSCGAATVRPDVVLFGENLDARISNAAKQAAKSSEVFLLVGTSAVVYPAADLAKLAVAQGAKLVIINLEPTPLDHLAAAVIHGRTEDTLPRIIELMTSEAGIVRLPSEPNRQLPTADAAQPSVLSSLSRWLFRRD